MGQLQEKPEYSADSNRRQREFSSAIAEEKQTSSGDYTRGSQG